MIHRGREGAPAVQRARSGVADWLSEALVGCARTKVGTEANRRWASVDRIELPHARSEIWDRDGRGWEIEQGGAAGNSHLVGSRPCGDDSHIRERRCRRVPQQVYPRKQRGGGGYRDTGVDNLDFERVVAIPELLPHLRRVFKERKVVIGYVLAHDTVNESGGVAVVGRHERVGALYRCCWAEPSDLVVGHDCSKGTREGGGEEATTVTPIYISHPCPVPINGSGLHAVGREQTYLASIVAE